MTGAAIKRNAAELPGRLGRQGLRSTPQRRHVYEVLLGQDDHPTAEEVFIRAKRTRPEISLATVYNCLDALVQSGLVRQVKLDRVATRFCANMKEHCHFYCERCGAVTDVGWTSADARRGLAVPRGYKVTHYELCVRGVCPDCIRKEKA